MKRRQGRWVGLFWMRRVGCEEGCLCVIIWVCEINFQGDCKPDEVHKVFEKRDRFDSIGSEAFLPTKGCLVVEGMEQRSGLFLRSIFMLDIVGQRSEILRAHQYAEGST